QTNRCARRAVQAVPAAAAATGARARSLDAVALLLAQGGCDPSSAADRLLAIAWLLFGLVVTNAFQGSLTSYLAVPKYLPDIDTVAALKASGKIIWSHPAIAPSVVSSYPILKDQIRLNLTLDGLAEIAIRYDVACISNSYSAKYDVSRAKNHDADEQPLAHVMRQPVARVFMVYECLVTHPLNKSNSCEIMFFKIDVVILHSYNFQVYFQKRNIMKQ
ncbi:Protein of unknown function, partial [Gryllus bimaculatus]